MTSDTAVCAGSMTDILLGFLGNHDVYEKEPVYNFEMHRALYGAANDKFLNLA